MTIRFLTNLLDNPYFTAGFGLFFVGGGATILSKFLQSTSYIFREHFIITLEISCHDKSYQWLLQWITKKAIINNQHLGVETTFHQKESGQVITEYKFVPSCGTHLLRYQNTWIMVERIREQKTIDLQMGIPWELVKLSAFGRNKELFTNILNEARQMALEETEGKLIMYTVIGSEWRQFGNPKRRRPIESVVLQNNIANNIISDCREFINNSKWYMDRGIPYRRGYLLYGPPGCGKSSFITALAGKLEYGICLLNLSDRGLTDEKLNYLMNVAPEQTIILLEDIDAAFISRENIKQSSTAYEGMNRVTFSGLLNCLDGVASSEGRIVFMTTNYIDRLDPALIRPGRVDVKEYIGYCNSNQLSDIYKKFYSNDENNLSMIFAEKVCKFKKPVSPAQIQGYFMVHKSSSTQKIIDNVEEIWKDTHFKLL